MADANISIPAEAHGRLAKAAAAEGLSLRSYLARLAEECLPPAERAELAEQTRHLLHAWNGYDPSEDDMARLDADLDRRLAEAMR
ncbi:hypothetical protein [Streptomyces sp. NPDC051173]|uniref:hypothetical protein n=1 Tax=Streptomyces sp. NPDC051173 TaxID=3155164 RepID=UPI00344CC148